MAHAYKPGYTFPKMALSCTQDNGGGDHVKTGVRFAPKTIDLAVRPSGSVFADIHRLHIIHNFDYSTSSPRPHRRSSAQRSPMDASLYTVVTALRSYLVTEEAVMVIRTATRQHETSVTFDALRCCGDCADGTVKVEEDVALIRGVIAHDGIMSIAGEARTNVIPLFR